MLGHDNDHDTYRSEITSIYGIVIDVHMLVNIGGISGAKLEVDCDGLSVLNRSFWANEDDISSTHAHFEFLSVVHGLKRTMDVEWRYRHISGHQDDILLANLDRCTIVNIECNYMAKTLYDKDIQGV